jgi:hypothetical protein
MNLTIGGNSYREYNITLGVNAWRARLRSSEHLKQTAFMSINGQKLDEALCDFTKLAANKRAHYIDVTYLEKTPSDDVQMSHPVYITEEERIMYNDISKQKKEVIHNKILELIDQLLESEKRAWQDHLALELGKHNTTKTKYISFYKDIKEAVENQIHSTNNDTMEKD